jgi:altered-inheritance-of-mitochondria protein 5
MHLANRRYQHHLIREQIDALNTIALHTTSRDAYRDSIAIKQTLERSGYSLRERPAMMELWKEHWNQNVQSFVRRAQEVEWQDVGRKIEDAWKTLTRATKGE